MNNATSKQYLKTKQRHPDFLNAVESLGKITRKAGTLDQRTCHLIQLAAATSIRSEGAVHSHTRRAMDAGATRDDIYHTIILLTSTIGFPTVMAALSWADDVIENS